MFSDLSSFGKSSLTVMIPALEMLGVEACPVATCLLSSQTDGFVAPCVFDTTVSFCSILKRWQGMQLEFDGIYSGYLPSRAIIQSVALFVQHHPDSLYICDPVLGDNGSYYSTLDNSLTDEILRTLLPLSFLSTPNGTEAAFLLHKEGEKPRQEWCSALPGKKGIITGLENDEGCFVATSDRLYPYRKIPVSYPGTGDLFDALLLGLLVKGKKIEDAMPLVVDLVSLAILRTDRLRPLGVDVTTIRKELATL